MSEEYPSDLPGFAPGSVLAGYRLEARVGTGGMAAVYRARDERLQRPVALKVLTPQLAADEEFRRRFIGESLAAAAVDDPHIIPVYGAGEAGGVLFIAMRFVNGGDLRLVQEREGALTPARTAEFISPVASALDAAHGAGLVHRDVKPGNILVDTGPGRPDHVYLSDFGISKVASAMTLTGTGNFFGTPGYSAPEQIEGRSDVDGRADQYALACVTYELLTVETLFRRTSMMGVLIAHVQEAPPPLTSRRQDLPAAVDTVMARALAKEPGDRYETCADFADALRGALALPPYRDYTPRLITEDPNTVPISRAATLDRSTPGRTNPGSKASGSTIPAQLQPTPQPAADPAARPAGPAAEVTGPAAEVTGPAARTAEPVPETESAEAPARPAEAAEPESRPAEPELGLAEPAARPAAPADQVTGTPAEAFAPTEAVPRPGLPVLAPRPFPPTEAVPARPASGPVPPDPAAPPGPVTVPGGAAAPPESPATGPSGLAAPPGRPTRPGAVRRREGARPPDWRRRLPVIAVVSALVGAGVAIPFLLQGSPKKGAAQPGETAQSGSAIPAGEPSASVSGTPSGSATGNAHGGPAVLQLPAEVTSGAGKISGIAFSPDGHTLAIADTGKVCVWDVAASRCGAELASAWAVAFSPDGKTVATSDSGTASGTPNGEIRQWDVSTGSGRPGPANPAMTNPGSLGAQSVAFSPDGQTLAAGDQNGSTYLWDTATGHAVAALRDPGTDPAAMGVNAVAFSGDGKLLAAADGDGNVYLWDTGTRKLVTYLQDPDSGGVRSVAFSSAGRTLAAGDGNGSTYLWQFQAATWTLARQFAPPGPAGPANMGVRAVTFSPDGQRLAIGDIDGTTDVRDVSTGRRLTALPDRDGGGVTSAAFRSDGTVLAVGDERGGVLLWPLGA